MDFVWERELIHLRYELRGLLADGRREEAAPLLERLREIAGAAAASSAVGPTGTTAQQQPCHGFPLQSEIARWTSKFDL